MAEEAQKYNSETHQESERKQDDPNICPVCGSKLVQEKCKVVCRSKTCVYRIIYNCSEF
jgi:NAD-dependent DNA ligase